jgi:PadR family transcriptional regulator, regulatory protein PadR
MVGCGSADRQRFPDVFSRLQPEAFVAKNHLTAIPRLAKYIAMQDIGGDLLRGHLETLVLSALDHGQAHGLEILRRLQDAGCGSLRLREGSLYPALYRLENAGLVEAVWEEETKGRRGARRRIYHLTRKGTAALARRRVEWQRFVQVVGGILGAPA